MTYVERILRAIPLIVLGLAGCGVTGTSPQTGFPAPGPSFTVSVSPLSITVAAGSNTTFSAIFTPSLPQGGSLTWSVNPANGGTISNTGVYTAPGTAGNYTVVATWTPSNPSAGSSVSASATVDVLPAPQVSAELNINLIQASGAVQVSSAIQNAGIVGQIVPSVISTDASSNVQVRNSFTIPVACSGSGTSC